MKCPKCGYNSFEYLDTCKKCQGDLTAFKSSHKIIPLIQPQVASPPATAAPAPAMTGITPPPSREEDFLIDNPAIVMATDQQPGAFEFGELSFSEQPTAAEPEPQAWDSPKAASAIAFDSRQNLQDLPDLFGDQPTPDARRERG